MYVVYGTFVKHFLALVVVLGCRLVPTEMPYSVQSKTTASNNSTCRW